MPIYEYRCEACGHTLDWLQKVSDPPLTECPSCNESALKRLISAPSFRLKGGGWYETDFKSDKDKRRNLAETSKGESADKSADSAKSKGGDEKSKTSDEKKTTKSDDAGKTKPDKKSDKKSGKGSEAA